jgi:hypothetical protein
MAAKKRKASKKSSGRSENVSLKLEKETILKLAAAAEALTEVAAAAIDHSDDPEVKSLSKRSGAKKTAKKRARKTS